MYVSNTSLEAVLRDIREEQTPLYVKEFFSARPDWLDPEDSAVEEGKEEEEEA